MNSFYLGIIYGYLHATHAPEEILKAAEQLKEIASAPLIEKPIINFLEEEPEEKNLESPTVVIGAKCEKCGHNERYSCNSRCVNCTKTNCKNHREKEKEKKAIKANGKEPHWDFSQDNVR